MLDPTQHLINTIEKVGGWCRIKAQNGARDPSLPGHFASSRSIVASTDIKKDDVILAIPADFLLTTESFQSHKTLIKILDSLPFFGGEVSDDEAPAEGETQFEKERREVWNEEKIALREEKVAEKKREKEHLMLMLSLMYVKHRIEVEGEGGTPDYKDPFWRFRDYVDALPHGGFTTPLWRMNFDATAEETKILTRLEGTRLIGEISDMTNELIALFKCLLQYVNTEEMEEDVLPKTNAKLWRLILWAHSLIESRSFQLALPDKKVAIKWNGEASIKPETTVAEAAEPPIDAKPPTSKSPSTNEPVSVEGEVVITSDKTRPLATVLLPIIDLANSVSTETGFNMITMGIVNGRAIVLARMANHHWFSSYGFCFEKNPAERVPILIEAEGAFEEDYEAILRKQFLVATGGGVEEGGLGFLHEIGPEGSGDAIISVRLQASLRIMHALPEDLEGITVANAFERATTIKEGKPYAFSNLNERLVWVTLDAMLDSMKVNYSSTLEEDEKDLERIKREGKSELGKMALTYLVGQKRILKEALALCKNRLEKVPFSSIKEKE
ncbi:hypothetical protein HDU97_004454 [Phlyctochytrium planicorne]|nr:hypothetical protein HDU97_004454 [Phlyctochytrium planicorne]